MQPNSKLIYQTTFWYFDRPKGPKMSLWQRLNYEPFKKKSSNFRPKGTNPVKNWVTRQASIFPGMLIVTDVETGKEVYRLNLTPDLRVYIPFIVGGEAVITHVDGKDYSKSHSPYTFYFINPAFALNAGQAITSGDKAKEFKKYCMQAAQKGSD